MFRRLRNNPYHIHIHTPTSALVPGDCLAGRFEITASDLAPTRIVRIQLVWRSEGWGAPEEIIVDERVLRSEALPIGQFYFTLPERPGSYEGSLVSITWAVRLIIETADGDHISEMKPITVIAA